MRDFVQKLEKQTMIIFKDIDITLAFINEDYWDKRVGGYIIWKQLYHMLNSIDRIYTLPTIYEYPSFHVDGLNSLDQESKIKLNKETLSSYFLVIKDNVTAYLKNMDDTYLLEEVICQEMKLSRFDLILAQIRHMSWHLGYIHSCIKQETCMLPEYIGINSEHYPID
ncbi:MAG: hypothetical protein GX660_15500 [Clostridiaceae bacterium]|nr:hypothetical protein [Clostridiaceae bacterium]